MARKHERRNDRAFDRPVEMAGLLAVAATAIAGAAVLFFLSTRAGQEARERLRDGDLGRRLQDGLEEAQRLAERGAAYVERKAAGIRLAFGPRAAALDAGAPKGE
jgi:hypothetical protein